MKQKHKQKETPPRKDLEDPKMIRYQWVDLEDPKMIRYPGTGWKDQRTYRVEDPKMVRYPGTEESEKEMLKYAIMDASEALVKPHLLDKNEATGKVYLEETQEKFRNIRSKRTAEKNLTKMAKVLFGKHVDRKNKPTRYSIEFKEVYFDLTKKQGAKTETEKRSMDLEKRSSQEHLRTDWPSQEHPTDAEIDKWLFEEVVLFEELMERPTDAAIDYWLFEELMRLKPDLCPIYAKDVVEDIWDIILEWRAERLEDHIYSDSKCVPELKLVDEDETGGVLLLENQYIGLYDQIWIGYDIRYSDGDIHCEDKYEVNDEDIHHATPSELIVNNGIKKPPAKVSGELEKHIEQLIEETRQLAKDNSSPRNSQEHTGDQPTWKCDRSEDLDLEEKITMDQPTWKCDRSEDLDLEEMITMDQPTWKCDRSEDLDLEEKITMDQPTWKCDRSEDLDLEEKINILIREIYELANESPLEADDFPEDIPSPRDSQEHTMDQPTWKCDRSEDLDLEEKIDILIREIYELANESPLEAEDFPEDIHELATNDSPVRDKEDRSHYHQAHGPNQSTTMETPHVDTSQCTAVFICCAHNHWTQPGKKDHWTQPGKKDRHWTETDKGPPISMPALPPNFHCLSATAIPNLHSFLTATADAETASKTTADTTAANYNIWKETADAYLWNETDQGPPTQKAGKQNYRAYKGSTANQMHQEIGSQITTNLHLNRLALSATQICTQHGDWMDNRPQQMTQLGKIKHIMDKTKKAFLGVTRNKQTIANDLNKPEDQMLKNRHFPHTENDKDGEIDPSDHENETLQNQSPLIGADQSSESGVSKQEKKMMQKIHFHFSERTARDLVSSENAPLNLQTDTQKANDRPSNQFSHTSSDKQQDPNSLDNRNDQVETMESETSTKLPINLGKIENNSLSRDDWIQIDWMKMHTIQPRVLQAEKLKLRPDNISVNDGKQREKWNMRLVLAMEIGKRFNWTKPTSIALLEWKAIETKMMNLKTDITKSSSNRANVQGADYMANDQHPTKRTKHVDIKHHAILQWTDDGHKPLTDTPTENNLSDSPTNKPLGKIKFDKQNDLVMGRRKPIYTQRTGTHTINILSSTLSFLHFQNF
eukprot:scaffold1246_cov134-Cylindrotheca_fusiformis.AAC.17